MKRFFVVILTTICAAIEGILYIGLLFLPIIIFIAKNGVINATTTYCLIICAISVIWIIFIRVCTVVLMERR